MKKIAILIPSISKPHYDCIESCRLYKTIKNIEKTIGVDYKIFVGVNALDKWYNNNKKYFPSNIKFVSIPPSLKGNLGNIWNILGKYAIKENYFYLHQTIDEIEYISDNWGIEAINNLNLLDGIGIVGFTDIITKAQSYTFVASLTTKRHFDLLGYYFNPHLSRGSIFSYITFLYSKLNRSILLKSKIKPKNIMFSLDNAETLNIIRKDEYSLKCMLDKIYTHKPVKVKLVSINIPVFNRSKFLPLITYNLLNQNYPKDKLEVNILDDSDKDPLFSKIPLEEFAKKVYPIRVNYYFDKEWKTIGEKRHKLVGLSNGDVIIHFDSDDYYFPQYISSNINEIENNGKVCCGSCDSFLCEVYNDFIEKPAILKHSLTIKDKCCEATLCFTKKAYELYSNFISSMSGECVDFLRDIPRNEFVYTQLENNIVVVSHTDNTFDKQKLFIDTESIGKNVYVPEDVLIILKSIFSER